MNYLLTTEFITRAITQATSLTMSGRAHQELVTKAVSTIKITGSTARFNIDCNHDLHSKFPTIVGAILAPMIGRPVYVHMLSAWDYVVTIE